MRTTNIRFSGLASGMDTESIVKSMIAPQQYKVDNAKQNKLLMELKKETWKEMNNKIYDFYRTTLNDIKFTNNYGKAEATISDSNVFKTDPKANMPEGEHKIIVDQLAKSATVTTEKITKVRGDKDTPVTKQTTLYDLGFEYGDVITINGKELTVQKEVRKAVRVPEQEPVRVPELDVDGNPVLDADDNPVMRDKIDADGNVVMQDKKDADGNVIMKDKRDENGKLVTEVAIGETTIGDIEKLLQSKKYEYGDKLDKDGNVIYETNEKGEIIYAIDEDGKPTLEKIPVKVLVTERDPNMNASFDASVGAFFISTKNTGEDESIKFSFDPVDTSMGGLANLGIITNGKGNYEFKGQDAEFTYNGIDVKQGSNKVNINGLQGVLAGEGDTTVSVTKDIQASVDFVKSFVEEYNKLIEEINTLVDAPANNKYKPLTDEQKKDMSESDIKLWDEKVKASVLRNDSTLKDLTAEMRKTIGDSGLSQFGIATGKDWKEKGKLYIDEEKLKDMLIKDPGGFEETLKKVGTDLYDGINKKLVRSTDAKSANFLFSDKMLDKQIKDTDKTIFTLEDRLLRQEDMYYKRFTAMEKMISQLNNQGSWLSSQLGGM